MTFQHGQGGEHGRCGERRMGYRTIQNDPRFGRSLSKQCLAVLAAELPAAIRRFSSRTRRDIRLTPADSAVVTVNFNQDRLELSVSAKRNAVGLFKRQLELVQHYLV